MTNTYNVYDTAAPFGGYEQSGFGRDMGAHALQHYMQTESVFVDLNEGAEPKGPSHRWPQMELFSPRFVTGLPR